MLFGRMIVGKSIHGGGFRGVPRHYATAKCFNEPWFLIRVHGPPVIRMPECSEKSFVNDNIKTAGIFMCRPDQRHCKALELFPFIDNCNRYVFHDRVLPRLGQESFPKKKRWF